MFLVSVRVLYEFVGGEKVVGAYRRSIGMLPVASWIVDRSAVVAAWRFFPRLDEIGLEIVLLLLEEEEEGDLIVGHTAHALRRLSMHLRYAVADVECIAVPYYATVDPFARVDAEETIVIPAC